MALRPFRFRAAVVLDLRRKQEEAARQQCRSLERAHDRAWRRHQVEESRHEGREMNLAANLRYLARAADPGGNDGDD